jgi:hypothetical protein
VQYFHGRVDEITVYNDIKNEAYLALLIEVKRLGMNVVGRRPRAVSGIEATRHQKSIEHVRFILALRAATINPAEYYGLEEQYGQVRIGMTADLILLRGNPLDNIENTLSIETVIFNGHIYDKPVIKRISEHVKTQARSWAAACKVIWLFMKTPLNY